MNHVWRSSAEVKWVWPSHGSLGCVFETQWCVFLTQYFLTVVSCMSHVNQWIENSSTTLTSLQTVRGRFRTESGVVDARLFPEGTFVCPWGWDIDDIWLGPGGFVKHEWITCSNDVFYVITHVKSINIDHNMLYYMHDLATTPSPTHPTSVNTCNFQRL